MISEKVLSCSFFKRLNKKMLSLSLWVNPCSHPKHFTRRKLLAGATVVFFTAGYAGKRFIYERAMQLGVKSATWFCGLGDRRVDSTAQERVINLEHRHHQNTLGDTRKQPENTNWNHSLQKNTDKSWGKAVIYRSNQKEHPSNQRIDGGSPVTLEVIIEHPDSWAKSLVEEGGNLGNLRGVFFFLNYFFSQIFWEGFRSFF